MICDIYTKFYIDLHPNKEMMQQIFVDTSPGPV
jgi:hypothetical protein